MPLWTASLTIIWVNGMLKCLMVCSYQLKRNLFNGYHCLDSRCQTKDVLYWPFTADGQYNCKSEYNFLKDLKENSDDGTHVEVDKKFWKSIWSLEIPNKYKNMLWRACRNSLPTKQNLVLRTILQNSSCDRCSLQAENTLHSLWSCTGLNEVWEGDKWNF